MSNRQHRREPQVPQCPVGETHCHVIDEYLDLKARLNELHWQASTDALTGLGNYRAFTRALDEEIERVHRSGQPLSLALVDVDHFKVFNDAHGHEAGNEVLAAIADGIREQVRQLDIPCRYGGEEFAVIMPATELRAAGAAAERIRKALVGRPVTVSSESHRVTASFGVATYTLARGRSASALIEAADKALYRAKSQGRNRVCLERPKEADPTVTQQEKAALFSALRCGDD